MPIVNEQYRGSASEERALKPNGWNRGFNAISAESGGAVSKGDAVKDKMGVAGSFIEGIVQAVVASQGTECERKPKRQED